MRGGVVGDLSDWLVLNTSDRFDFLNIAYKWLLDNEGAAWAREVEKEFLAPIDVRWVASRLGEFAAYGGDPRGLWRVLWDSYTTGGPSLKRDVWERVGKGKANESWLKVAPHDIMVGLPPFSGMVGPAVWSFYEAYKSVIYAPESLGSGFAYLLRDYFRGLTSEYVSAWVRSWGYDKASLMFVLLLQKEIPQDLASTDSNELEKGFRGLLSRVLANHCYAMRTLSIMRQRLGGIDVSTLRETMPPENLAEVICDVLSAPLERDLKGEGVRDEDMRRRAINTIIRDIRYTPDLNITAHGFNMLEQIFKTAGADNATHLPTFISVKG